MAEDEKLKIEKFNDQNFRFWKMQMDDYLYQKNFYQPLLSEKGTPEKMDNAQWKLLDWKALATIRLCLHQHVTYNVAK